MIYKLRIVLIAAILFSYPVINFAQAPNIGSAARFVLFSSNGAVSNTGTSQLTGNIGTNKGSSTGFGNVDGVMHDGDSASVKCAADLLKAYNKIDSTKATGTLSATLGNGDTVIAGVYSIKSATTLNSTLYLDAKGNGSAVFIFKIKGAFSTNASSKVKLLNGAKACNVFWNIDGMINMATGTTMRGTLIANNAAIKMNIHDTLEGRALSTTGAVTVNGIFAYTPIGCGSPVLKGPKSPDLRTAACYALFSSDGAVKNSGVTHVTGDVGTNVGLTTGFDAKYVSGKIHTIPDSSTAQCAKDLTRAFNYVDSLKYDIELLYPAKFGMNLVLTPHTYLLNAATVFTDSLYLNAEGSADAVFVIKIKGAFSTSTYSRVILMNGTQSKNVYWLIDGAVTINNYSVFRGTIICNNGALGAINTGVTIDGRALTTNGALSTTAVTADIPSACTVTTGITAVDAMSIGDAATIFPNPFGTSTTIRLSDEWQSARCQLRMYNVLGAEVMNTTLTGQMTTIETAKLPSGVYFYKIISNSKTIRSGRLISRQ